MCRRQDGEISNNKKRIVTTCYRHKFIALLLSFENRHATGAATACSHIYLTASHLFGSGYVFY